MALANETELGILLTGPLGVEASAFGVEYDVSASRSVEVNPGRLEEQFRSFWTRLRQVGAL